MKHRLAAVVRINGKKEEIHIAERPAKCQVICVASGKGGTGKTVVSTNLSISLARLGLKVILFDADLGLANSHLLLGVDPLSDISAVIKHQKNLKDVIVNYNQNLSLLPGGTGLAGLSDLSEGELSHLSCQMSQLEEENDVMVVDCAAGIHSQVFHFLKDAHDFIIVVTPEVTSMIDGYAVIKNLSNIRGNVHAQLIVNRFTDQADIGRTYNKMVSVCSKHLSQVRITLLGAIPHTHYILNSIRQRQPFVFLHPQSLPTRCMKEISASVHKQHVEWRAKQNGDNKAPSYFSKIAALYDRN